MRIFCYGTLKHGKHFLEALYHYNNLIAFNNMQ